VPVAVYGPPVRFWQVSAFLPTDEALDLARATEDNGFHGMMVSDHVFYPQHLSGGYPYTGDGMPIFPPDAPWPDSYCLISAMAAVTHRLRFSNSVFIAAMRDVLTVARSVGTAAVISGNRVALGVGAGWMREEFEAFGVDFRTRGRRLDEMIEALRTLWQPGFVEHHGEFFDFGPLRMDPAPSEPVPIWCGGVSDAAIRRATQRCDGWIGEGARTVDEAVAWAERVLAERAAGPRADVPFELVTAVGALPTPDVVARLEGAGVTGLLCAPWMRADSPKGRLAAVEDFADRYIR
jgi:probable F420-dependent oxidoreductase